MRGACGIDWPLYSGGRMLTYMLTRPPECPVRSSGRGFVPARAFSAPASVSPWSAILPQFPRFVCGQIPTPVEFQKSSRTDRQRFTSHASHLLGRAAPVAN